MVVIEDNPGDIYLIRYALGLHAIEDLTVIRDGEAGYEFVTQIDRGLATAPQVFIVDFSLPRRTGPELLELIRASRACAGVRIVIASSSRSPKDQAVARKFGADCYFAKPSNFEEYIQIGAIAADLLHDRP